MQIKIMQNVLAANEKKAAELKQLLRDKGIYMINIISSPGSGKTTLLEKTLPQLSKKFRVAVIEGDVETDKDALRLDHYGVPVSLINTCGACHLESVSIEKAFTALDLDNLDLIIIENVGNLVCPAEFDVGEDDKIAMLSTAEGDDKVLKYPLLFQEAAITLLNKTDLIELTDFNREIFYHDLAQLRPDLQVIELSCKKGSGLDNWLHWLEEKILAKKGLTP